MKLFERTVRLNSKWPLHRITDLETIASRANTQFIGLIVKDAEFEEEVLVTLMWESKPAMMHQILDELYAYGQRTLGKVQD